MPLAFDSLSHGRIAFGFFNIETDMLLCDRYFLFADDFCRHVGDMAAAGSVPICRTVWQTIWKVHYIRDPERIGDLTGAIHGVRHTGFIGELYRCFPFPDQPRDFKQNPQGFQTRAAVSEIITKYAELLEIQVALDKDRGNIQIGDYRFSREQFQALIAYVWRGGYPRWKDEIRPVYVSAMRDKLSGSRQGVFAAINLP